MKSTTLDEIDILKIGNTIQIGGAIWTGEGRAYIVPLPDEDLSGEQVVLRMDKDQFERFLNQTDVLAVQGPGKAILRKSQRQIDQWMAWEVFERDGYRCRYCGRKAPLTVDHVILWEQGGATVSENLVSACRRCNKVRGNMDYEAWIGSDAYGDLSAHLDIDTAQQNFELIGRLDSLREIKAKPRSR